MNEDIKLEYMHLCDYAAPALNGKVNLSGIFESFFMPKESSEIADFYIAFNIKVIKKIDYKISFEIQSSKSNEKIFIDKNTLTITSNAPTLSFNILKQIKGADIKFKEFGVYKFVIIVNDLPIGFNTVEVKQLEVKNS